MRALIPLEAREAFVIGAGKNHAAVTESQGPDDPCEANKFLFSISLQGLNL